MADDPPDTIWVHPNVIVRNSRIEGRGLFSTEELATGVIIQSGFSGRRTYGGTCKTSKERF
jgi:hypothetical protein